MPDLPDHKKNLISNPNQDLIWKEFRKGKKWAFEKIYKLTYDHLYRFGIKFIQNPELIEDIIHDLFFKLWQRKETLSHPSNIKAYLLSSVRATIINHLKKESRNTELSDLENFNLESSVEEFYISNENLDNNIKVLNDELNKLTAKQKEAIYLHFISDFNYKDVSDIMGIKPQSVRNLVHEGITKLKLARDKFLR